MNSCNFPIVLGLLSVAISFGDNYARARASSVEDIFFASFDDMNGNHIATGTSYYEDEQGTGERRPVIFPGTKWCGAGNISMDYNDLGKFNQTDACCRAHDHCEDVISAGEEKYHLLNPSYFSRLHCDCDDEFYDCLHKSADKAGPVVGMIYFDLLNTKCFKEDHPHVGCKRKTNTPPIRCLEYKTDTSQPKRHQWFDVKPFRLNASNVDVDVNDNPFLANYGQEIDGHFI